MGVALPKAVESIVVKRECANSFRVGLAEMNGWRPSMEDAHVIVMHPTWGFFAVLDGHGGSECSAFVAKRLTEELNKNPDAPPKDDAAVKKLCLDIDAEFLDKKDDSGSTGTFALITPPTKEGGRYDLRVGNIGDSRVLLGQKDGNIFAANGTDGGITTDHKPDHPDERARIERNGGTVQTGIGQCVSRVNGELAVSRAFGDGNLKQTGGPGPEERPVTADPEFFHLDCDESDFLMLVCDGISEGNFPNQEVVRLAAKELFQSEDEQVDPGRAAAAVCEQALASGSRDNLSCMIVLFGKGSLSGPPMEVIPGAIDSIGNGGFRGAYTAMSEHAGLTLAETVEKRYDLLVKEAAKPQRLSASDVKEEMGKFGSGPPEGVEGKERTEWFQQWVDRQQNEGR